MSPTMIHRDEARDLVFVWHGDTVIQVYTATDHADRAQPFDTISVWDDHEDEPAIGRCPEALAAEANAYVSWFEGETDPMVESSGYGTPEYLAVIL